MLKDTGERVIPEKMKITNELLIEHIARYHFAVNYANGRVLDFASGSGYGTHITAKKCKKRVSEVIGVDIDLEVVEYARKTYYHPLTTYLQEDVTDPNLPKKLGQFDTILSFETIEHVEEEEQFLSNIYNLLKPGGKLVLSTPFGQGRGKPCGSPFHVHQLTEEEFNNLFNEYSETHFYYQKGALIEPAGVETNGNKPLGLVVCQK
ncbi:class I SAM-dependent methyltransferase [Gracilibacillus sp. YIM 98692]|uniref:class I SAM-dependent methyltransferase n=1 Tax=Gracilibacillus sp. YIM 98692 TaxID=2663532 RepID=UPI0013D3FC05|nr:class I SAM-dependent methyltransferase [Gracilibacillus sp. YIM 98692]